MDSFLKMVAADLYQRMQGDLSRTVVVFPNKRAMLYFDEYLTHEAKAPMWAPTYTSISDLLCGLSDKQLGDPVKLVCDLYKVFPKDCLKGENLDEFYFWGDMLLKDFDDVDKSMVDAKSLFCNLENLKEMDDLSFLTPEQEEAARTFFHNFSRGDSSKLKKNFSDIWNQLGKVYEAYRSLLSSQGIAYEGMLYREAIEKLDVSQLPYDKYVFIGFNVLTHVEHKFFSVLQKEGKAIFYWDYDIFYIHELNHEASTFLAQNVKEFPSPLSEELFDAFSKPKTIQFVETSTENAQARYLPQWLSENITTPERDTAIVLCNESLLSPVLHSMPESVGKVNVTMGYPFLHTPAYSLVNAIMDAHVHGYNKSRGVYRYSKLKALLCHPFVRRLSQQVADIDAQLTKSNNFSPAPKDLFVDDILSHLFTPATDKEKLCDLMTWVLEAVAQTYRDTNEGEVHDPLQPIYKESIFKAYTLVNRFRALLEGGELSDVNTFTFCTLLQRAMSAERIPFHGEPAEGVQIMGVIETRNLDFRHLVMLSVNDGFMPHVANDVSFIPYNLRKAFGMATMEHKISIYAYYFYRLLQRAETVTLVYNAVTDDKHKGELSRFMLQLLVDSSHEVKRYQLEARQKPQEKPIIEVQKTPAVMASLRNRYDTSINSDNVLSPSALNAYLECSLRFYYHYVAGMKIQDEVDDEVDSALFGTLFHKAVEDIYNDLVASGDNLITEDKLKSFFSDDGERIKGYVDKAFKQEFFNVSSESTVNYNGQQLITKQVIEKFVHTLLKIDIKRTPFTFLKAEEEVYENFEVTTGEERFTINIGGTIDRQDSVKDDEIRIVDYKTGGKPKSFKGIPDLFKQQNDRAIYVFQIFLYSYIMKKKNPYKRILPHLLYIHCVSATDYKEHIQLNLNKKVKTDVTDFTEEYESAFSAELMKLLNEEIFNSAVPFRQTPFEDSCRYCDFKALCHKTIKEW